MTRGSDTPSRVRGPDVWCRTMTYDIRQHCVTVHTHIDLHLLDVIFIYIFYFLPYGPVPRIASTLRVLTVNVLLFNQDVIL